MNEVQTVDELSLEDIKEDTISHSKQSVSANQLKTLEKVNRIDGLIFFGQNQQLSILPVKASFLKCKEQLSLLLTGHFKMHICLIKSYTNSDCKFLSCNSFKTNYFRLPLPSKCSIV